MIDKDCSTELARKGWQRTAIGIESRLLEWSIGIGARDSFLLVAMGWLVFDDLRMRSKQLSKYELPVDPNAPVMLEFMRKMAGSEEIPNSFLETSNTKSICIAIQKAYGYLFGLL